MGHPTEAILSWYKDYHVALRAPRNDNLILFRIIYNITTNLLFCNTGLINKDINGIILLLKRDVRQVLKISVVPLNSGKTRKRKGNMVNLSLLTHPIIPPKFEERFYQETLDQFRELRFRIVPNQQKGIILGKKLLPTRELETEMVISPSQIYGTFDQLTSWNRPLVNDKIDILPISEMISQVTITVRSGITNSACEIKISDGKVTYGGNDKYSWMIYDIYSNCCFGRNVLTFCDMATRFCLMASIYRKATKVIQEVKTHHNFGGACREAENLQTIARGHQLLYSN